MTARSALDAPPAAVRPRRRRGEALRLVSVTKVYGGTSPVTALRGVSLALAAGSFTSVMGPSGSGKSTLLQCAAGLDEPTSGQVFVDAAEVPRGDEAEITRFRRERIGFVFQQYNLIPYLTVTQNVTLPLKFAGATPRQLLGLVTAECGLLLAVGVPFGTVGGLLTVIPFSVKTTHRVIPNASIGIYLGVVVAVVALTIGASLTATRRGTRTDAITVLSGATRA
jgi:ABC-type sugar transport system ATPase subunit